MAELQCNSCGARWYTAVRDGNRCPACGAPLEGEADGQMWTFEPDPDNPAATLAEIQGALPGLDERTRTRVQILLAELLGQATVEVEPGGVSSLRLGLTPEAIRIDAAGPSIEEMSGRVNHDPLAEWRAVILERVADRWGLDELEGEKSMWFEVRRDAN
jgi:hypothetical protein